VDVIGDVVSRVAVAGEQFEARVAKEAPDELEGAEAVALAAVGAEVVRGRSIAVVELAKSIVSVKSPVGGTVVAVNPRLGERPELVHLDPYGEGWLATLRLADFATDAAALVHGAAVRDAMTRHARLHRIEGAS
jgi:glycine cleavage system H lipoate-binding protein